jgi:hypothetical protein
MVSLWCRIKAQAVPFTKVGAGSLWIVCSTMGLRLRTDLRK